MHEVQDVEGVLQVPLREQHRGDGVAKRSNRTWGRGGGGGCNTLRGQRRTEGERSSKNKAGQTRP